MRFSTGTTSVSLLKRAEATISPFFGCSGIWKTFPKTKEAILPDVSIAVPQGHILALIGASGCGKTTLLNILAGFLTPDRGEVMLKGKPCRDPGSDRAVVFQDAALFPWLNALENVEMGLKAKGLPPSLYRAQALSMLEQMGLQGYADRFPAELSGGQKQRVALARIMALSPAVLLLDEPFAALDAITREQMQELLITLHTRTPMSMILVTHDVTEALLLADEIAVMSPGRGIIASRRVVEPRPRKSIDPRLLEELRVLLRTSCTQ